MTLRVVVVHERFTELGGSELVVRQVARIFDGTRVLAPVVDPRAVPPGLEASILPAPPLQRLYPGGGRYAHLLPLLPTAMRGFRFPDTDLVITSHHAFANRIRPRGTPALSYTHTPARWLWESQMRRGESGGRPGAVALSTFAASQRRADRLAAHRMDRILVNSSTVQDRVQRWWGRESTVVHPPVDTTFFCPDPNVPREDFLLLAGRLVPYKRPDVAVDVAARLGLKLVVAGDGRSRAALEATAGPNTVFLGRVTDEQLRSLFRRCQALVFPGEEDFGMIPVEAQACGAPVVALDLGGARDTVVHGRSGLLYPERGPGGREGLSEALETLQSMSFDPGAVRASAERFAVEVFERRMLEEARAVAGRR
jgi:glycosyltransferase involved in cell wall biosynthesis